MIRWACMIFEVFIRCMEVTAGSTQNHKRKFSRDEQRSVSLVKKNSEKVSTTDQKLYGAYVPLNIPASSIVTLNKRSLRKLTISCSYQIIHYFKRCYSSRYISTIRKTDRMLRIAIEASASNYLKSLICFFRQY